MWWVPVVVFVLSFGGGVAAAARWLPELARGPLGGIAFFAVCGLAGAAVALAALHIYETVRLLEQVGGRSFEDKGELLAGGLAGILFESGCVFAGAAIVFLLAPRDPAPPAVAPGPAAAPPSP